MHNKQTIKNGFIWSALDSLGTQAIGLVISLILANLLGPSAYGLIAMLAIFMAIASVFVNSGFSSALIRKTDRSEADFSTTFYFSLAVSIVCYLLLFFCAPYIATFYEEPELVSLTRALALIIVINTFAIIPRTLLTVNINFKAQAIASFTAIIISGSVGLYMALNGFGVWSLVGQQISSAVVRTAMLYILSPWRPKTGFCRSSFKELFGFGSKLLASGLLESIFNNAYGLIIGKQFSPAQLGIFNQANMLSSVPAITITGVIQKVTFPMLSNIQHDTEKLDATFLLILKLSTLIIFPIMLGISIIAEPLIALLLGEQWRASAELLSILALAFMLYPIHAINLNFLTVKGRSDLILKLELIKKVMLTIMLIIAVPMGIKAMCIGMVVTSYLALFMNTYYTAKLSTLSMFNQFKVLLPIGIIATISAYIGYMTGKQLNSDTLQIICMLIIALFVYITIMLLTQRNLIISLRSTIKA